MRKRRRARRGEGSVSYDRTARVWIARVSLGVVGGKRVRHKASAPTEDAARDELARLRRLYGQGGSPGNQTLDEYLGDWLRVHGRSVRPSTRISYAGHIEHHIGPLLGGIPLARLRPSDVRRLVDELERKHLRPATIGRVVTTLRIALNAALRDRSILDNPAAGIRLPRVVHGPVDHQDDRPPHPPVQPDRRGADGHAQHWGRCGWHADLRRLLDRGRLRARPLVLLRPRGGADPRRLRECRHARDHDRRRRDRSGLSATLAPRMAPVTRSSKVNIRIGSKH